MTQGKRMAHRLQERKPASHVRIWEVATGPGVAGEGFGVSGVPERSIHHQEKV